MKKINIIILAAGKGCRMQSSRPKVLHNLVNKTLLEHVFFNAKNICNNIHIVYGFSGNKVRQSIQDDAINWVEQRQQLGTGHAVSQAMENIEDDSIVLILYGDVPLIKTATLKNLIKKAEKNSIAILSAIVKNPTGYGRIIRVNNKIQKIVEQKDATQEQLKISEVNTGIMAVESRLLKNCLTKLTTNNANNELYLTDIIYLIAKQNKTIHSETTKNQTEALGVNSKLELVELERSLQKEQAIKFIQNGLDIKDINRFDCRGEIIFGKDCEMDINTIIKGKVILGNDSKIGANCSIKDSKIGDNVDILPNTLIEDSIIENGALIGPFARIRPGSNICQNAKVGNFVEVKKSIIGKNSKVSHLSYIGDSEIGENVNVGAGVITCNYDGRKKHKTIIKKGAFIGSGTQLVAPVTIGENSIIGAGSVITKDTPDDKLTLSRVQQTTLKRLKK
jgi:bifunctional UDP-N-acetylglucosamine pyrophosphorylase/glucosamine-1-phosphate N-acetyltransferase